MHGDELSREPDTSAARRSRVWSRRRLSTGVTALIWALRLYVIAMVAVIILQISRLV